MKGGTHLESYWVAVYGSYRITSVFKQAVLSFSFHISAVLIEWIQAPHLQGQDDSDHQVWNKGYKSKYAVL